MSEKAPLEPKKPKKRKLSKKIKFLIGFFLYFYYSPPGTIR
jgi:hypothetical protein